jgi:hypothetical protein
MSEVGVLMGQYNPYLEHLEPTLYLNRLRTMLSSIQYKGKTSDISESEMNYMWEETLRVTEKGVEEPDALHQSDTDDSAEEASVKKKKGRKQVGEELYIMRSCENL